MEDITSDAMLATMHTIAEFNKDGLSDLPQELRQELIAAIRQIPDVLDIRRIVALADRAATNPTWWKCCRLHFFCPSMTHEDIAAFLGLRPNQVRDYLRAVTLSQNVYDNIPEF